MSVEGDPTSSTFYINSLNPLKPAYNEPKSEGDDHICLVKKSIKNTFPNIDAPVTATEDELNYVDITTLGTQQASKAVTADANNTVTVPSGGEINFASGSALQIAGVAVTATAAELNKLSGVTADTNELNILDGVTLTAAQVNGLLNFGIQFYLPSGTNADFVLDQYASFAYTVNSAVYDTASGTISANVKIDGTSIDGLSALSLTSSEGGPTSSSGTTGNKTVDAGDTLSITLSSNSSATGVSIKLNCTRT